MKIYLLIDIESPYLT